MGMRKPKERKEKGKEVKKQEEKKEKPIVRKKLIEGVKGLVRVAEVDLPGEKKIPNALLKIKGIGQSLANAIPQAAGIDSNLMIGTLSDEQIDRLEAVIKNPLQHGIPFHMLNRRRDPQLGLDRHIVSSELIITTKSDIDLMKKARSYKGIRHELGLPVRGQRTRSSFRTGMRVGVLKGLAKAAAKPVAGAPAAPTTAAPTTAKPTTPATKPEKKEEKK